MGADITDKGLEFYPVMVSSFDSDEFELLEESLGELALLKFIKLRNVIYSEGYFLKWDESRCRLFCKRRQYKVDDIHELVKKCCLIGLFNLEMYEWYGILTSFEIQANFVFVAHKRANLQLIYDYLLFPKDKWVKHKIGKFPLYNIMGDKLEPTKLHPPVRPKKKVYVIDQGNLFSPTDTKQHDRETVFKEAAVEFSNRKKTEEFIPDDSDFFTIDEAVEFCKVSYSSRPIEFTERISKAYYSAYQALISWITKDFVNLKVSTYHITFKQFQELYLETKFEEDDLRAALEKLSGSGINKNCLMKVKIRQYLKYVQNPDSVTGILNKSNPNNVQRLN